MHTMDCLECDMLRAAYRCATRKELDLKLQLDEAEIMGDNARLQELRALLGAVAVARASAGQSVLDPENLDAHRRRRRVLQPGSRFHALLRRCLRVLHKRRWRR